MSLTIIAGTHTFVDLTRKFRDAWAQSQQRRRIYLIDGVKFAKHRFERVEITKEGEVIHYPSRIFPLDSSGFMWSVAQPTGSGKTILAVYHLNKTYRNGGNVDANFSYQYFDHNLGKDPKDWTPTIQSIEDIQKATHTHLVLDDIKGTIEKWQAKEADIVTLVANTGRKESVDLDFTTQRVINYMPPNIRAVATGYEIPYITIRDCRKDTPDGKGFPVEMEVFSLLPADSGDVFVGFGCLNKDIPDGKTIRPTPELLNSYKTMEIAIGLKVGNEEGARPNQPGYQLEVKALEFLKEKVPNMNWEHLNGKHVFDIISETHAIDVTGMDADGNLITEHKNMMRHISTASKKGQIPYLMFPYKNTFGFLKINKDLDYRTKGQRIDTFRLRIRTLDDIFSSQTNE